MKSLEKCKGKSGSTREWSRIMRWGDEEGERVRKGREGGGRKRDSRIFPTSVCRFRSLDEKNV